MWGLLTFIPVSRDFDVVISHPDFAKLFFSSSSSSFHPY
jgi:hypothetical protein